MRQKIYPMELFPDKEEKEQKMPEFSSVVEALDYWRKVNPQGHYCTIHTALGQEEKITFRELWEESKQHASFLKKQGLQKGERVILAVPNGRAFLTSFLGTLMAGGVAVPVVTRDGILRSLNKASETLGHIFRDVAAKYVLTTKSNKVLCEETAKKNEQKMVIALIEKMPKTEQFSLDPLAFFPDDVAFIQYTSGSTSLPKGVVIRHQQLIAQLRSIVDGLKSNMKDCAVSWLPLFHDMGLIGVFLHSLYVGMKLVLMSPERFLFDPKEWLRAISKHKATLSAGPNFAYNLCVKKIRPEDIKDLDLSSWRVAFSGSEPISPKTMQEFSEKFKPYGFNPDAIVPGYGMAENCLAISFVRAGKGLMYDIIKKEDFEKLKEAIPAQDGAEGRRISKDTVCFVSVGQPVLGHEVVIIDEETKTILPDRHIGEIAVRGPSVMAGYYHKEKETRETIQAGWLHTGDLGYLANGNLYIVGRKKDMIIIGGRNFCPQDIEAVCAKVSGVRIGCVVAFGVYDEKSGTEKLQVLAEIKARQPKEQKKIANQIVKAVVEEIGIAPNQVLTLPPGTLSKTSSGKLQREKYKQLYLEGHMASCITLRDRFRYFRFRVLLLISMFFYYMSSLVTKWRKKGEKHGTISGERVDHSVNSESKPKREQKAA